MAHIQTASYPICPLCIEQVELETANTDEKGRAVHEDCYAAVIVAQRRIFAPTELSLLILHALAIPKGTQALA
jgi:hypothetical protein